MKFSSLIIGLIGGIIIGYGLTKVFTGEKPTASKSGNLPVKNWQWADSLDATKAAPENHKVLFENDQVRILEVILKPYEFENLHTHKLPSVMFGAEGDTSTYDIIYYRYGYDSLKHAYFVKDSTREHNSGKSSTPNSGYFMKPEGPHRIKNLSNVKIDVFRIEFKKPLDDIKSN